MLRSGRVSSPIEPMSVPGMAILSSTMSAYPGLEKGFGTRGVLALKRRRKDFLDLPTLGFPGPPRKSRGGEAGKSLLGPFGTQNLSD